MHKIILIIFLFSAVFAIFPAAKYSQVNTILVIIEETQNDKLDIVDHPVSDGIFDALWNYDQYMFFDMRIKESIKITNSELDPNDYLQVARNSGADSILLIKVNYLIQPKNSLLSVIVNDFYYKLIVLKDLRVVKKGNENLNFSEVIELNNKNQSLKKAGDKIIKIIFD